MSARSDRPDGSREHRAAALGLLLVVAVLFSQAISTERAFFYRDIHSYWYQQASNIVRAVAAGEAPLWNPYVAFGAPMLAEPAYQIGYPFTWLNLVLAPALYYKALVLTHCFGTGWGFYRLARALQLGPVPAFVGASAWTCCGPLLSTVSMTQHFTGATWMPWVILALQRMLERPTFARSLILGLAIACQILAGSADMCVMTAIVGVVLACSWLRTSWLVESLLRRLVVCAAAVAFALALSAVQWIPALAILPLGSRHLMGADALFWSVHPLSLLDLVVPRLVSDFPMSPGLRDILFESREPFLSCLYLGAAAAGFVILCARGPSPLPRLGVGLGFALLIAAALGRYTPLDWALLKLPFLALMRYPVKYMVPAAFLWCLLLALGVAAWQASWTESERRRSRWAAAFPLALAAAAAVVALAPELRSTLAAQVGTETGPGARSAAELLAPTLDRLGTAGGMSLAFGLLLLVRSRRQSAGRWLTACAVGLALGDLLLVGRGVNGLAPPELLSHRPPFAQRMGEEARFFLFPPSSSWLARQLQFGPAGWEPEWRFALGLQEMLSPPIGARWRLYGSYDGDFTGLAPPALLRMSGMVVEHEAGPLGRKLLQMGSVGYVVALHAGAFGGLPEVGQRQSVFASPLRLFQVPEPLPRAYVVDGVRVASGAAAFDALSDSTFDPRREVVLPEPNVASPPTAGFLGSARVVRRSLGELGFEVESSDPGFLVVTDEHHPGWRATVDGAPRPVVLANALFRAVPVPAGKHSVELRYRPLEPFVGAAVSALAAAFGVSFGLLRASGRGAAPGAAGAA